jgi:hypothetical protein
MSSPSPASEYLPDEVAVALCVYGPTLEPEEITALLGVAPTHAHRAGERAKLKQPPGSKGAWIREIRRFEPVEPDRMFEELFDGMNAEASVWLALAKRFELRVDFAVHTDVGATFRLNPETLARIASLGASFQIYIQAYGDNGA